MPEFHRITVGAFWTNVLDLVGKEGLVTRSGEPVTITRSGSGAFIIQVGNIKRYESDSNSEASFILNSWEVGFER